MQRDLEKLQNLIGGSSLTDENKAFWEEKVFPLLGINNPIMATSLLTYLDEKPEELEQLTDITKRKFVAFGNNDKEAIGSILKEEQEKLNSVK